jgi:hypothetical protein
LKRERFAEELREKQEQIARIQKEDAEDRAKAEKVALEQDMIRRQDKKDRKVALGLYKKHYKDQMEKKGRSVERQLQDNLKKHLVKDFERTNQLTKEEQEEWEEFFNSAGDKEKKEAIKESTYVKEVKSLSYVPAKWYPGDEPAAEEETDEDSAPDDQPPLPRLLGPKPRVPAHFLGLMHDPKSKFAKQTGPLNPDWVKYYFKGVFVQLVMLQPGRWWPVVVGKSREGNSAAPKDLLVPRIKIIFPQNSQDHCLIKGVASSLFYCGLKAEAHKISGSASKFECLTKPLALQELKNIMRNLVPCIGDCMVFNVRNSGGGGKKKKILTIEDLLENKTRYPTVVIPYGKDGSNNHSFVVVDDLIFDSTQTHAMRLCRDSLDWICGGGMDSINVALRFNTSHGTKEKLKHKDTTNW